MMTEKIKTKKWYESKTLLINAFVVIGGVLTALAGELEGGATLTALGVVNIVLRIITQTKIN